VRIRLVAALAAAIFVVPVTVASAAAPRHECPASNPVIQHKCK
jgi:hypothetical protein